LEFQATKRAVNCDHPRRCGDFERRLHDENDMDQQIGLGFFLVVRGVICGPGPGAERSLNGSNLLPQVIQGVRFVDGLKQQAA